MKSIIISLVFLITITNAHSFPCDTLWIKKNVKTSQLKFSLTGDSIICLTWLDTARIQIRSTSTGDIIKEFNLDNYVSGFTLSPNGKNIYLNYDYYFVNEDFFIGKPLISTINLETGNAEIIIISQKSSDSTKLTYYLYSSSTYGISLSKDEKYLITTVNYKNGTTDILYDLMNKSIINTYGSNYYNEMAVFSPTENYFVVPNGNLNFINPDTQDTSFILKPKHESEGYDKQGIAISPNGTRLICLSNENYLHAWNLVTKSLENSRQFHSNVFEKFFFPDNKLVAIYCDDGEFGKSYWWQFYDTETMDSIFSFPIELEKIDVNPTMDKMVLSTMFNELILIESPKKLTLIDDKKLSSINITIYPNPNDSRATIEFEVEKPSNISISLYNTLGELVRNIANISYFSEGIQKIEINTQDLPPAAYFLKITEGSKISATKIFIKE